MIKNLIAKINLKAGILSIVIVAVFLALLLITLNINSRLTNLESLLYASQSNSERDDKNEVSTSISYNGTTRSASQTDRELYKFFDSQESSHGANELHKLLVLPNGYDAQATIGEDQGGKEALIIKLDLEQENDITVTLTFWTFLPYTGTDISCIPDTTPQTEENRIIELFGQKSYFTYLGCANDNSYVVVGSLFNPEWSWVGSVGIVASGVTEANQATFEQFIRELKLSQ